MQKRQDRRGPRRGPARPRPQRPQNRPAAPERDEYADLGARIAAGDDTGPGRVILRQGRARPLWFGHPWVYANAIERVEGKAEAGEPVALLDHDGRFIGRGLWSPRSQIPVRLLTRQDRAIDEAFFRERIAAARGLRTRLGLPSERTNVYRLVNSEGDGLPGLVVDVFGDALAVQVTTIGMAQRRDQIIEVLQAELNPATIFEVGATGYADIEGFSSSPRVASGQPRHTVPAVEDGIRLEIEPLSGQKTGMFIDQRETRIRVGQLARGARVLDCYAYAGGFSLQAMRGGAKTATAVDSSPRAVERIEAHARLNGVSINAVEADVFRFLETATPRAYDLVIIDPPKFARARKDLDAARKGYERLNTLALQTVAPGGVLVTCSCSQNVDRTELERILAAAAKAAGRAVRVFETRGAAPDHPLPPGFSEGEYLKVLLAYVE